ncbi:MAG: ClpXP protease specificity-enhancing factor [Burkholderiales bacterium]|nr:ClpXP protease specificity-enhancing factor [Nitrosomonas sp.]MCP5273868.1 ClpXP protease specificity-enhancing factor [Burkholderiales bacterium]
MKLPSTKPYLIRSIYEWCIECGYTPLLSVQATPEMNWPEDNIKNEEIIFNVGPSAVHNLVIGNDIITFSARFGGIAKEIIFPTDAVKGIFAREVNQGIAFPEVQLGAEQIKTRTIDETQDKQPKPERTTVRKKGNTNLRIVK